MNKNEARKALEDLLYEAWDNSSERGGAYSVVDKTTAALLADPQTVLAALGMRVLGYVDDPCLRNDALFHTITVDIERESDVFPLGGMVVYAFPDTDGYGPTFHEIEVNQCVLDHLARTQEPRPA